MIGLGVMQPEEFRSQIHMTLYTEPNYGAAIAGMGVSGETLDTLACTTNSQGTCCRVGYPGQSGRVLWAPSGSLIFLGDGE